MNGNAKDHDFAYFAAIVLKYKSRKSPSTYAQAKNIIEKYLIPFFGNIPINEITEDQIEDYLSVTVQTKSIYDHKKYLKAIFRRAIKMRIDVTVPDMNIQDPAKGRGKVFTRAELARMLWACRSANGLNRKAKKILRDYAKQIRLAYSSGMRRGECAGLRWEFIEWESGWVHLPPWFQKTRTTVDRSFMLQPGMLRVLRAMYARPDRHPVQAFPGNSNGHCDKNHRGFQRLLKRAGIEGYARFHDLRYTNATNLLRCKKFISPQHVMKLLGMSQDTLKRYTVIQEDVARYAANQALREAI